MDDRESRQDRFARVENHLSEIYNGDNSPAFITLPEIWGSGFFCFDRYKNECETLDGETFSKLAPWARKIGCYILAGSIVECDGADLYNTSIMIGPEGEMRGYYRKIHLFGHGSEEAAVMTAGSKLCVIKTEYGNWGLSTCYDLRFPEIFRRMLDMGADSFFVTACWPATRILHWEILNRARALENLAWVISCNCAGKLNDHELAGSSMVVDPWGEIAARAGDKEEILTLEIDPDLPMNTRKRFPALEDRRIR